jgi:hypothetical protein
MVFRRVLPCGLPKGQGRVRASGASRQEKTDALLTLGKKGAGSQLVPLFSLPLFDDGSLGVAHCDAVHVLFDMCEDNFLLFQWSN